MQKAGFLTTRLTSKTSNKEAHSRSTALERSVINYMSILRSMYNYNIDADSHIICSLMVEQNQAIFDDLVNYIKIQRIIMKSLDPLRAKKIFIRKKLGHTAVSAIKASSVDLYRPGKRNLWELLKICKFYNGTPFTHMLTES